MTDDHEFDAMMDDILNQYPQWFQDKVRMNREMRRKGGPEAEAYFRAALQLERDIINGTNRSAPMDAETFARIWGRESSA